MFIIISILFFIHSFKAVDKQFIKLSSNSFQTGHFLCPPSNETLTT